MKATSQAIITLLILSAFNPAFAAYLRHSFEDLSLSSHYSPEESFKIPLKKRTISLQEMNEFQEFVSLSQRASISSPDLYDLISLIESDIPSFEEPETLNTSLPRIRLSRYHNTQYTGVICIGDSNEEFEVIFDTGSANMWINSKLCSFPRCIENKQYDSTKSNTFQKLGKPLEVQFGSGSLVGEINADNLWFGGIQIENQSFAMIREEYGDSFMQTKLDGIVGLAYPKMAAYNLNPLFDSIIAQKKLNKNVFSFYFDQKDESHQKSNLMIGGVDKSLIDGEITYFPVVDKYYWTIEASAILVDGDDIGLCENDCRVIVDTGTSLITGPKEDLINLISHFPLKSVRDCQTQRLPDITFVLKNGFVDPANKIGPREMKFTLTQEDYLVDAKLPGTSQSCTPGFMPLDIAEPHGPAWILGDIFLTKFVSVYDRDNDVVGFAKAKLAQRLYQLQKEQTF